MPVLIDVFNVLHTAGVLPPELAGLDLGRLVDLIQASRYRRQTATLVCDGRPEDERPPKQLPPNVRVRYSGRGRTADDVIAKLIAASTAPRRLIVVSSDHAVIRAAKRRGCKVLRSPRFLAQLSADVMRFRRSATGAARPARVASNEIDDWVATFALDSDSLKIQAAQPSRSSQPQSAHSLQAKGQAAPSQPNRALTKSNRRKEHARPIQLRPGEGLPQDLIEQAERLWAKHARRDARSE